MFIYDYVLAIHLNFLYHYDDVDDINVCLDSILIVIVYLLFKYYLK